MGAGPGGRAVVERRPGRVLQLHAQISDIEPPIWRRLLVPEGATLAALHRWLQVAFGWENRHLHAFRPVDFRGGGGAEVADRRVIGSLLARPGDRLIYDYDFGDSWEIVLGLEQVLEAAEAEPPACSDGARAGPPEDCGGAPGYDDLIEALAHADHPDRAELLDWLGDYDPGRLDLAAINRKLAAKARR
jgi:hypothetical protein